MDIITSSSAERTQEPEYPRILPVEELYKPLLSQAKAWAQKSGIPSVPDSVVKNYRKGASFQEALGDNVNFQVRKSESFETEHYDLQMILPALYSALQQKVDSPELAAILTVLVQREISKYKLLEVAGERVGPRHSAIIHDFAACVLQQPDSDCIEKLRTLRQKVIAAAEIFLQRQDLKEENFKNERVDVAALIDGRRNGPSAIEESGMELMSYIPALDVMVKESSSEIFSLARQHILSSESPAVLRRAGLLLTLESCRVASDMPELIIPYKGEIHTYPDLRKYLLPYILQQLYAADAALCTPDERSALVPTQLDPKPRINAIQNIAWRNIVQLHLPCAVSLARYGVDDLLGEGGTRGIISLREHMRCAAEGE